MLTTVFTTWTKLFGETIDEAVTLDPGMELNLDATERELLKEKALDLLTMKVDEILSPWNAQLIADGSIVGPADMKLKFHENLEEHTLQEEFIMARDDLDKLLLDL